MKTLLSAPIHFSDSLHNRLLEKTDLLVLDPFESPQNVIQALNHYSPSIWICNPCPAYKIEGQILRAFAQSSKLPVLSTPSTGTNHIDLAECDTLGVKVFSLQTSSLLNAITASSEYTLALMLSLIRNIPEAVNTVTRGNWRNMEAPLRSRELSSLTLGIIGYGRIGSNLARYASALGMRVISYDPYKFVPSIHACDSLESLLPQVDILACCVHLGSETSGMINNELFAKCKKGVVFVNTSRGEVVDEEALIAALEAGQVSKAAVDVICDEAKYDPHSNRLVQYSLAHGPSRMIVTPHIAGLTTDSEEKAQWSAFQQAFAYHSSSC